MITYCRQCVMPETKPDLQIDEEGICSACRHYEARKAVDKVRELGGDFERRRWESNPLGPGCSRLPGRLAPASVNRPSKWTGDVCHFHSSLKVVISVCTIKSGLSSGSIS